MKDPTIPELNTRKKIMFYDSEDRQARLKVKCMYDEISQSQFFRMMITGYIENDDLIFNYIKSCKERYSLQGKNKRLKIDQVKKQADEIKNKFSLYSDEIQDIFDVIEMETNL